MRMRLKRTVLLSAMFLSGLFLKIVYIDQDEWSNDDYFSSQENRLKSSQGKFLVRNVHTRPRNLSVDEIKILAAELNSDQRIRNIDKFGLMLNNNSVVILIQVHTRLNTLKILVESLRHVKFINETLVIFSHDVYSVEIFKLVQSIDFCPVMQLFYPFAIQTHENVFPGSHPNDCPRNLDLTSALERGCNNAEYPDQFKHYREAHLCQIRHHWLWKIHFAFDRLRILSGFKGTILRLEDDYYLSSDVIHFIRKLNERRAAFPDVNMYILGNDEGFRTSSFKYLPHAVMKSLYFVGVGACMTFTRTFWNAFKNCSAYFCTDDDYNWDYALHHTAVSCIRGGIKIVRPFANRVFHIGKCLGVHARRKHCKVDRLRKTVQRGLKNVASRLFPDTIKVIPPAKPMGQMLHYNGGWGDQRDHQLCLDMFNNVTDNDTTLKEIHDNLIFANVTDIL